MLLSLLSKRSLDVDSRDAYGFALRYREYTNIYKEEEEERSEKWKNFLDQVATSFQACPLEKDIEQTGETYLGRHGIGDETTRDDEDDTTNSENILDQVATSFQTCSFEEENKSALHVEICEHKEETDSRRRGIGDATTNSKNFLDQEEDKSTVSAEIIEQKKEIDSGSCGTREDATDSNSTCIHTVDSDSAKLLEPTKETQTRAVQTWCQTRPSLNTIEIMMSSHVNKGENMDKQGTTYVDHLPLAEEVESIGGASVEDSKDKEAFSSGMLNHKMSACRTKVNPFEGEIVMGDREELFSWKEELECLVHGGVPRDLRGEVWQAFVGVKTRRIKKYYQDLLNRETNISGDNESTKSIGVPEKLKRQIEKDIPRTFPGHPALNEYGRNSLRRLLSAYALHNPSVGYCQGMNFFAGLLLLLMPEENAFWALVGIIDDYFNGYFTEEMIESQVDMLVFEELMRERFPKLVKHLDYLGVQVAWVTGPWFLSIFVNMLPWESVLRVWDVILFEGNRVMVFRTALALMELHGPSLVSTTNAGDAITLLQSLASSTFDSSQLVFTACMGFLSVTEVRLQELREKFRPSVLAIVEERNMEGRVWKDSKGLASKLYSFKHNPESPVARPKTSDVAADVGPCSSKFDDFLSGVPADFDSLPLEEQIVCLKAEMCNLLEEKRSVVLRYEEMEIALLEAQDNRRQLSSRIEQLELELAQKKEQEVAMLQLLIRVEREQKVTEDARRNAEQDVAAQKFAVHMLQEKYEKAMTSLVEMEKRAVMAESLLEATLQYESGQVKATSSPGSMRNQGSTQEIPRRMTILPFTLGWRDRNKGKSTNAEEHSEQKIVKDETVEGQR